MLGNERCVWKDIFQDQRKTEVDRGLGFIGTTNYEVTGCNICDGLDRECNKFYYHKPESYDPNE